MTLFRSRSDFEGFLRCLIATQQTTPMRLLAYCVMNNHWHLVLWPRNDGDLARFMLRLTTMHVRRWLINRHQVGTGHVYQGRYKSFAIQDDGHLATACRYVERNPVRVKAVKSSADWDQENGSSLNGIRLVRCPLVFPAFPLRSRCRQQGIFLRSPPHDSGC